MASEDCAFGPIGFQRVRDVAPGEMLIVTGKPLLCTAAVSAYDIMRVWQKEPSAGDFNQHGGAALVKVSAGLLIQARAAQRCLSRMCQGGQSPALIIVPTGPDHC